jgi:hypothetical protein
VSGLPWNAFCQLKSSRIACLRLDEMLCERVYDPTAWEYDPTAWETACQLYSACVCVCVRARAFVCVWVCVFGKITIVRKYPRTLVDMYVHPHLQP